MALTIERIVDRAGQMGCPLTSLIQAGQFLNQNRLQQRDALALIAEMTGKAIVVDNKDQLYAAVVASYLMYLSVRAKMRSEDPTVDEVLAEATNQADRLLTDMAWAFTAEPTDADIETVAPEIVIAGKAKKGARKVLALRIYADKIVGKDLKRKEAIAILMEEVGLTSAGASTYYAKFKSGEWA